jgi:hypothetical protein
MTVVFTTALQNIFNWPALNRVIDSEYSEFEG